jgi:hypothetical protein
MGDFLKSFITVIGLIAGVVALVSGVLGIVREYRSNQAAVNGLIRSSRFWVATSVIVFGIAVLTVVLWRQASRSAFTLLVRVWDVEGDHRHRVVASKQFEGIEGTQIPDAVLQELRGWLEQQIGAHPAINPVAARIHIPADWANDKITFEPATSFDLYLVVIAGGGKARVRLPSLSLPPSLSGELYIEVSRAGYETQMIQVVRGQSQDKTLDLKPVKVQVGVEEFQGEPNSIASWLVNYLAKDTTLEVKDPNSLHELQEEIHGNQALLAKNPGIQQALRTELGLNFIIGGSYEKYKPPAGN